MCILFLSPEANIAYDFYTPFPLTKITLRRWLRLQNIILCLIVLHSSAFTGLIFLFKNYIYGKCYDKYFHAHSFFHALWMDSQKWDYLIKVIFNVLKVLDKCCLLPLSSMLSLCVM